MFLSRAYLTYASLAVFAFGPAQARTWVATPDGSGGDGTIAQILPVYADGDSIRFLPGEHAWEQELALHRSVTLYGDAMDSAVLAGEMFAFTDCDSLTVRRLTLKARSGGGTSRVPRVVLEDVAYAESPRALHLTLGDYIRMERCVVRDNVTSDDQKLTGIAFAKVAEVEVKDCVFRGNSSRSGELLDHLAGGGASLFIGDHVESAVVTGCLFVGNTAPAGGACYQNVGAGNLLFEHNTIVGNFDGTGAVTLDGYGETQIVRYNIFANNQGYGLWCGNWTPHIFRVYCNVFWQNDGLGVGGFEQDNWFGPRSARGMEGFSDFYSVLSDPEFCDDESYGVTPGSPIRMLTEPCMEVPGTGRACDGAPPVKNRSWGEVKRHFGR